MCIILWVAAITYLLQQGGAEKIYSPIIKMEAVTEKILEINTRGESRIKKQEEEQECSAIY